MPRKWSRMLYFLIMQQLPFSWINALILGTRVWDSTNVFNLFLKMRTENKIYRREWRKIKPLYIFQLIINQSSNNNVENKIFATTNYRMNSFPLFAFTKRRIINIRKIFSIIMAVNYWCSYSISFNPQTRN